MAIDTKLSYADVDGLCLDPMNPRLGRSNTGAHVTQERVLELMRDWTLDELAVSFLEGGGFWTHEALLVTREKLYGKNRLVVVEGNRRLAALRYLRDAVGGRPASRKWAEIADSGQPADDLFARIPYFLADSREDVWAFLGFRHVTGIKEWKPAEKAEFIARMVDEQSLSYREVMRRIGSKTPTVRQNYISYRMLLQIEETIEDFPRDEVEDRFSVMYLSLRTEGVKKYLHIDIQADPETARRPVPPRRIKQLANFALWMFGTGDRPPLFTDSRQVDNFGKILESREAVDYLERSESPSFDVAYRTAGGDEQEIVRLVQTAADNIELALTRAHLHAKSKALQRAVERLGADANQLLRIFPEIQEKLGEEG